MRVTRSETPPPTDKHSIWNLLSQRKIRNDDTVNVGYACMELPEDKLN